MNKNRDKLAVLFALVFPTLLTWAYFVVLAGTPLQNVVYGGGKLVQFTFPLIWTAGVLGLALRWPRPSTKGLTLGLGFGLLISGLMLVLYHFVLKPWGAFDGPDEAVRQKVIQLKLDRASIYIALAGFYALGHSLLEEYYWRWFVFGQLRRLGSLGWAIAISSLGFMAHHVILLATYFSWTSPYTYLFSLAIAIGGAFWAWLYDWSKSIYGPWIGHLCIDAAIFIIGYDLVSDLLK